MESGYLGQCIVQGNSYETARQILELRGGNLQDSINFIYSVAQILEGQILGGQQVAQKRSAPSASMMPPMKAPRLGGDSSGVLNMLVPNETVGWIIGQKGASIADVQRMSGASVSFEKEEEMLYQGQRKVMISGPLQSRQQAEMLISQKVSEKLAESGTTHEQLLILVPNEKVKFVIGKGGSQIKEMEGGSGARISIETEAEMPHGKMPHIQQNPL